MSPSNSQQPNIPLPTFKNALFYEKSIPEDWALCVHPQGWIYFYNANLKVVTDHDIRKPEGLETVRDNIAGYSIDLLEENMEVHLHVQSYNGFEGVVPLGLAISHKHCVASYNVEEIVEANVILMDPKQQNRARRLYWNYLWNHPTHVPTPSRALKDAADALTWFHADNLVSGAKSVVPFSKIECDELSAILKDLAQPYHENSTSKTVFLAWLLREVCSFRDSVSYGVYTFKDTQKARNARDHSSRLHASLEQTNPVAFRLLNLVINCIFFGIPHTYWAHIKTTSEFRGRLSAVQTNWENYIERLVREYSDFLLISTVLLSATVGFLSVGDISEGARLAATVSALTSMSSIIIGVFSIWRHQTNTSTKDLYTYMHNVQYSAWGIPGHAILLSLPPALLMWAIVGFTIAILAYVAQGATTTGIWSRISAGTLLGIFAILLIVVLLALYNFSTIWSIQRRNRRYWGGLLTGFRAKKGLLIMDTAA